MSAPVLVLTRTSRRQRRGCCTANCRPFLDIAPRHTHALLECYQQNIRVDAQIEAYVQQLLAEIEMAPLNTLVAADGTTPAITLSRREREILRLVERGLSNREIARKLIIDANTVKSHLHRIYQRLGIATRYQTVMRRRSGCFRVRAPFEPYLFGREAIAHARLGQQVARTGRITLLLAAQLGHVDAHVVCCVGVCWLPDLLEQLWEAR